MQDDQLAKMVRSGDHAAMLELWSRYADLVRRQSSRFGQHVTFSIDDARQLAFISMITAAGEAESSSKDFANIMYNRVIADLKDEAARQRFQTVVPLRTFRFVAETAREFGGDFAAARNHLDSLRGPRRITTEVFDSVFYWAFSTQLEWSNPAAENAPEIDYVAGDSFQHVEDRDAVEQLLSTLTDTEREVVERLYGLGPYEVQVSEVVGTVMGMNAASIRRIHSRVLAKLQINSDLPDHWR